MKWLLRFLGYYDKAQAKKSDVVDKQVAQIKVDYHKKMIHIKKMATKSREQSRQNYETSVKLDEYVDDVVNKLAIATGGRKIKYE